MTSEEGQRPGGGDRREAKGGWSNKLHTGFFFSFFSFCEKVQQGSVAHAERLVGNGGDESSAKVSRGQGLNGRCGVWPRVADRFMNGD